MRHRAVIFDLFGTLVPPVTSLVVAPEECLYVGDSDVELAGAKRAGMTAIKMGDRRSASDEWTGARVTMPGEVFAELR